MEKQKNTRTEQGRSVPILRFSEFKGEWESKKLGSIAKFSKGKGISKTDVFDGGATECIRYGELYTHYREIIKDIKSRTNLDINNLVLSEQNDIIIPASGETQIDISTASCVLKSGVALGGDLNIIKTENNGVFLSYYLNNKKKLDIANLAQGISVVHLYSSQLALLDLNLPTIPEQQKIASFLTSVDERLAQLTKKKTLLEQYKKGVMQRIFSQEIRFKDDNGKEFGVWEEKTLSYFLTIPEKQKPSVIDRNKLLTVKLHTKGVFKNDNTDSLSLGANYFIRKKGQFIYGKQNLFNGAFSLIPDEFDGWLSSTDVPSFNVDTNKVNPVFFLQYFSREFFYKKLEDIASGSGSKRIHENVLLQLRIDLPSIQEQTKIANFLSAIDKKIEGVDKQLEQTKRWKKGLLQQMFI